VLLQEQLEVHLVKSRGNAVSARSYVGNRILLRIVGMSNSRKWEILELPTFSRFEKHSAIATGWRRVIGCPELQVIFRKRATKYKSLLRKMIFKDKGSYESSPPCIATGWRRVIQCLKLQVIFRKRATNYRALLRKMTCTDKASYDSTPPCIVDIQLNNCFAYGVARLVGSLKL